ncbi:MAG: RNA polymerase sigma factor [Anaerolineales bacterium]|nr:RNA polymerase sigma factor [Anaerolineales bacterium]MCZ2123566.1 RNA polymerase sigma factor [Anaerolineales bacterium]
MDEQTAIARLKQGDLNGLETLVDRYQARAVRAAYLVVYDRAAAEDIAQTAFIKVAERIQQFDEALPFAPWFFRIVLNDALKLARKQKRTLPLDEADENAALLANWMVDPAPQPEMQLEEKQVRENLLKAIYSLPPEQRAVIVMQYYLNLSEAEMSSKMNRPLSSVKWWLRDARKRLRELIGANHG